MKLDAIFLPGKIHGCKDELYIVYYNPEGGNGNGCFEIEIIDRDVVLNLWNQTQSAQDFMDGLPDIYRGSCAFKGTDDYEVIRESYSDADYIAHDGIESEVQFIIDWAKGENDHD